MVKQNISNQKRNDKEWSHTHMLLGTSLRSYKTHFVTHYLFYKANKQQTLKSTLSGLKYSNDFFY